MSDCTEIFYTLVPLHQIVKMVFLSMACGAISMVLTKATVFNFAHDWLEAKVPFLGKLFNCPWCTSHWVAALLVSCYSVDLMYGMRPAWSYNGFLSGPLYLVDFAVNVFIMVVLAAVSARIISSAYHHE
jgi:hypothetical protein